MTDTFDFDRYDRVRPIRWTGQALELLDQRKLPFATEYLTCNDSDEVASAIHALAVHDWPATQCALARLRTDATDGIPVAERFELYLGPVELANGYHELLDPAEQRMRFDRDLSVRAGRGAVQPPLDEAFLAALGHGLPDCAGVALGVDRQLMAMLGTERIADVLAFDFARS